MTPGEHRPSDNTSHKMADHGAAWGRPAWGNGGGGGAGWVWWVCYHAGVFPTSELRGSVLHLFLFRLVADGKVAVLTECNAGALIESNALSLW